MLVELLQAVLVHLRGEHVHKDVEKGKSNLNGRDVLSLLNIDVSYVQPNVTEVSSSFTHLVRC